MLAEVDLPNRDGRLRPGMYARVTLTLAVHHDALSLPSEAVMGKDPDRFVYTVAGDKARKTVVRVGVDDGKMAEITEGLKPGARVVLVGRDNLVDGAAVKAEAVKPEPAKK
jgi:membrane fusion protein (multidrug efflux system)